MARFVTQRDFEFIQHITRELIDETMDVAVILYKIIVESAKVNIYGESATKPRYTPVKVNAIIKYDKNTSVREEGFGVNQDQQTEFRFARRMLQDVNTYPEIGDIIGYNNHFYEIHNITETQLIAGKPGFNTAIICMAHLTRRTSMSETPIRRLDLQQEKPVQDRSKDIPSDGTPPIAVTLFTIDNAILGYMNDRIKPLVTQNNVSVKVPVIYGNPERWKSAQRDGIMRDSVGKIQLPMIMIRRTGMKKSIINSPVNKYLERTFETGWNRRTPYDQFAVKNGITPSREYLTTTLPDYYEITYRCMIWTEYMEQMNAVVENISFETDQYWGDQNNYKFRTSVKSFEPMTELPITEDRVVRTQFDMTVYAYLLPETALDKQNNRSLTSNRRFSIKKTVVFTEIESE